MAVDHLDNITINIVLDPAPPPSAGFGTVLLLVDQATNTLNGDRVRSYASVAAATADNTAGYISAGTLAAVTAAFAQPRKPAVFKVGRVDTAGGESYADGLAACIVADGDFYGIASDSRADADILSVSAAVEALRLLFVAQSADADWKTASHPSGLTALETRERTAVVYHDTAAQWSDVAWLVNRLSFDPDEQSAPWNAGVAGVSALATAPTDTEKGHLDDNYANHGLPYGGETFWIDAGVNQNGRPLYEIVTADWYYARLQERVSAMHAREAANGRKIQVSPLGQAQILAEIRAQNEQGVGAGHFTSIDQTSVTAEAITSADTAANRLRFTGQNQIAGSLRLLDMDFSFSRDPIA